MQVNSSACFGVTSMERISWERSAPGSSYVSASSVSSSSTFPDVLPLARGEAAGLQALFLLLVFGLAGCVVVGGHVEVLSGESANASPDVVAARNARALVYPGGPLNANWLVMAQGAEDFTGSLLHPKRDTPTQTLNVTEPLEPTTLLLPTYLALAVYLPRLTFVMVTVALPSSSPWP